MVDIALQIKRTLDHEDEMTKRARHIRARWAAYLSEVMLAEGGPTVGTVARGLIKKNKMEELSELQSPGTHIQNAAPRQRVRRWINGTETVRAASAYSVGEALRKLHIPGTSGVVALFVAGFYPEVIELLVRLSANPKGAWPALAYYVSLEYWLQHWAHNLTADPTEGIVNTYDLDDENTTLARRIGQSAIDSSSVPSSTDKTSTIADVACDAIDEGRGLDLWTKKALRMAEFESKDDSAESFSLAWGALKPWARKLYRRCGGKPGYPLYSEVFRLGDYATPPLEYITSLIPTTHAPRNRQKG
jgi:hypothetical protein